MAALQAVSAEVLQSSITLQMPLLFWQAPFLLDDSSKHAARAMLDRTASLHTVWWDIVTADQQALAHHSEDDAAAAAAAAAADALIGLEINGHLVKVSPRINALLFVD